MDKEQQNKTHGPEDEKNILEWSVFGFSLLLILGILIYLIFQTVVYKAGSPDLHITFVHDPSPHAPYRYFLQIRNDGKETAEEVVVDLVLEQNGEQLEVASLSIPYSPKQSVREGWVNFSNNPSKSDTVYARVVSYKKPG